MKSPDDSTVESSRRTGDLVAIPGDYQHRALEEGPRIQRQWHRGKLALLDWYFEVGAEDRVLDVGSGSGVFAHAMSQRGAEVVGVDANPEAVRYAKEAFGGPRCSFRDGLLDELTLPSESFSAATCLEIVEHVHPDQGRQLLKELRRILRPKGRILVTTPNYRGSWPLIEFLADRLASTAKMDADQHITHFHRRMLRNMIVEAGFQVESIRNYCTIAPFAAAISFGLARRIDGLERKVDLPFGNLLAAVATRP